MTAPTLPRRTGEATDYLAAVERELADLPADERSALLEDLALHLQALAAEDDDRPVLVRLGPPAAYAAELRAAAGLPPRPQSPGLVTSGLLERLARVQATPAVREALRLLGELRPAWWVLRGYLLVAVPCLVRVDGARDFPVPSPLGSPILGLLLVGAAVVGSVVLGRRRLPRAVGAFVAVGGVVLVGMALAIAVGVSNRMPFGDVSSVPAYEPAPQQALGQYPLVSRHGPVTDVLPYAADGTPLEGVLLYDQDGRPLQVGFQEWWADGCARVLEQPRAADGVPVPNVFPQSYELAPLDVDLYGNPMPPGTCTEGLPRPEVPLPVLPGGEEAGESAGAPSSTIAPVPGG